MFKINKQTLFWIGLGTVATIMGGLFGWYIFINKQQGSVDAVGTGRGFSSGIPTFEGEGGSMRENLASFFESTFGGFGEDVTATTTRPRLWKINPVPGAGLVSFATTSGDILRFVERPTGNVFEVSIDGGTPKRLTNTLIPRVYEVFWINKNSLILRHGDEYGLKALTFLATIKEGLSGEPGELSGEYLDDDIDSIAVSPNKDGSDFFYLTSGAQGTFGILSDVTGETQSRLWRSSISGWQVSWISDDVIEFVQNAAEGLSGSSYTLSRASGETSLVVGNKAGLISKKHPTQDAVIYSTSVGGQLKTFARVDGVERELPIKTIADKCVWGKGSTLQAYCAVPENLQNSPMPDAWYRGEVTFKDRWFVVDPTNGVADLLVNPKDEFNVSVDVVDPSISADGGHLLFTDSTSGTLWVLKI
jgi:hypothetical protein